MFWAAFLIVIGLCAALLLYASTRPGTFRVERSTVVGVSPAQLFAIVRDLRSFDSWSPWAGLDPAMRKTFIEPTSDVGGSYAWEGNNKVGAGRMEIAELVPDRLIRMNLAFLRPFKAKNVAIYTLEPVAEGTRITWAMTGPLNLMAKVMHLIINMDRMCGRDFETGLANLKRVAEA